MNAPVACRGAPRDMGLDQGVAAAPQVAEALRVAGLRGPLARWRGRRAAAVAREVGRHFPHLAERTAGLARGAGVPRAALFAALAREGAVPPVAVAVAAAPERTGEGALLVAAFASPAGLLLRRSEPDNDYASLEVAAPWAAAARAGVNARGLAAAAVPLAPAAAGLAAPASLLVQDCLQRFDAVEKAVEWCTRRPAGGRAVVLLADASGQVAAVHVDGPSRRVARGHDGIVVAAREEARPGLEKSCAERPRLASRALAEAVAEALGVAAQRVVVAPSARRLELGGEAAELDLARAANPR